MPRAEQILRPENPRGCRSRQDEGQRSHVARPGRRRRTRSRSSLASREALEAALDGDGPNADAEHRGEAEEAARGGAELRRASRSRIPARPGGCSKRAERGGQPRARQLSLDRRDPVHASCWSSTTFSRRARRIDLHQARAPSASRARGRDAGSRPGPVRRRRCAAARRGGTRASPRRCPRSSPKRAAFQPPRASASCSRRARVQLGERSQRVRGRNPRARGSVVRALCVTRT
jgi:hypothetical protein